MCTSRFQAQSNLLHDCIYSLRSVEHQISTITDATSLVYTKPNVCFYKVTDAFMMGCIVTGGADLA